jgi:TRAP-type C4-dicarboxylate transport system permease small subunit
MARLQRIDDLLAGVERTLIVCLYAALITLIVFNIGSRNLLHLSFYRILEIAPVLVLWLSLLGATLGLKRNRHIRLELFLRFCPDRTKRIATRMACGFGVIVMGLLCCAALQFTVSEIKIFGPWGASAVIFPLFFALAAFRYLIQMLQVPNRLARSPSKSSALINDRTVDK